jgi:hypothetical protein
MTQDGLLPGLIFAWKQSSSWKREGHLLVIRERDGKLTSRPGQLALHLGSLRRSAAHRNHAASVSDLGIALLIDEEIVGRL